MDTTHHQERVHGNINLHQGDVVQSQHTGTQHGAGVQHTSQSQPPLQDEHTTRTAGRHILPSGSSTKSPNLSAQPTEPAGECEVHSQPLPTSTTRAQHGGAIDTDSVNVSNTNVTQSTRNDSTAHQDSIQHSVDRSSQEPEAKNPKIELCPPGTSTLLAVPSTTLEPPPVPNRGWCSRYQLYDTDIVNGFQKYTLLPPGTGSEVDEMKPKKVCARHKKNLKLYCETCGKLICKKCIYSHHPRPNHQYILVEDTFPERIPKVSMVLQSMELRTREIEEQRRKIEVEINEQIELLHKALEERKTKIVGQLNNITERKLKSLASEREKTESLRTQLFDSLEYTEDSLDGDRLAKVMAGTLRPCEKADMLLARGDDYYEHAEVVEFDPPQSGASGKGLKTATVDQNTVIALNNNDRCVPADVIIAELVCCQTDKKSKLSIEEAGEGEYRIQYQPTVSGEHQLNITVGGEHAYGSPHCIQVGPRSIEMPIKIGDNLDRPWGITTDSRGRVIVTEHEGHCVTIFSAEGTKLKSFGRFGEGIGQFTLPTGVAVDEDDNIYVADKDRIQKFNSNGKHLCSTERLRPPFHPVGIAMGTKYIYACDKNNCRVQILTRGLKFEGEIGSKRSESQFKEPCGIALDKAGNVYVADTENGCIQVFDQNGKFLNTFRGDHNMRPIRLSKPSCIAIDGDRFYITDQGSPRCLISGCIFPQDMLLQPITTIRTTIHCSQPTGITIDRNGYILVTDSSGSHYCMY